MKDPVQTIAVAVIALVVGAAGAWLVLSGVERPTANSPAMHDEPADADTADNEEALPAEKQGTRDDSSKLRAQLTDSRKQVTDLSKERDDLKGEKTSLEEDNKKLKTKLEQRDGRIKELEELAAGPNRMLVSFGKWGEMKEVRETDWNDLGEAYVKMIPLLKELAASMAEGKTPDPETRQKIQSENQRLIAYYAKVIKKLPTNAAMNGEFTHPINMVNILAGQLAEAGMPLSDDQKKQLAALGDRYDERWDALQKGYDDKTWMLQKLYDEADLKQWFYDEVFKVTTTDQKDIAIPVEVRGMVGLDLYSPGLMLQGNIRPLKSNDLASLKQNLKTSVTNATTIPAETLDGAEYIFDDWLNALNLQPMSGMESNLYRTLPIIQAAKQQLVAMHALDDGYVVDEEIHKKLRFVQTIIVPQVVLPE
ncbi:MAG: hypothetical protein KDB82_06955 [Planctomycetes bacterium]|nr:hypothetical protein [Planctomycetota bacterium]